MSESVPGQSALAQHDRALLGLLDGLLAEVPPFPEPQSGTHDGNEERSTPAQVAVQAALNDRAEQPLSSACTVSAAADRVLPNWAREGFRVLLFRIGDFRFSMPLIRMRGIFLVPGRLVRVPGQPEWHCGLTRYRGESVVVADLGSLLGIKARCVAPRYLLLVGDGFGALECDQIEDAILVEPEQVRWSRVDERRPWLTGLIADQMCALLDADAIAEKIGHG